MLRHQEGKTKFMEKIWKRNPYKEIGTQKIVQKENNGQVVSLQSTILDIYWDVKTPQLYCKHSFWWLKLSAISRRQQFTIKNIKELFTKLGAY